MAKQKFFMRCGICDMNFHKKADADRHFNSLKHRRALDNPVLVAEKIDESQMQNTLHVLKYLDG